MDYHNDQTAVEQFEEAIRLFAQPGTAPEKYALHNGLAHLSKMAEDILRHVREVDHKCDRLQKQLDVLSR